MIVFVFVRRLKPGVTFEQFREAWFPPDMGGDESEKLEIKITHGLKVGDGDNPAGADSQEILTLATFDAKPEDIGTALQRIAEQNKLRHDTIEPLLDGEPKFVTWYEVVGHDNFKL